MRALLSLVILLSLGASPSMGAARSPTLENTPIVGGPCEGCEAVFDGMPLTLRAQTFIAAKDEPGARMVIRGQVRDRHGKAVAGVIVYAYHTDHDGIYPAPSTPASRAAARHGRLRGWARTDDDGRYEFDTIRPGGYPGTDIAAHVHLHVIEPGRCTYYIDDIIFDDDPRLTGEKRRQFARGRGGPGLTFPRRGPNSVWYVDRHIVLGAGIPDYPQ